MAKYLESFKILALGKSVEEFCVRFPMLSVESSCRFSTECHRMSGWARRQDHQMVRSSRVWVLKRRSASKPRFFNSIHFKFGKHTLTDCKGMEGNCWMFPRGSDSSERTNSRDWQRLSEFRKNVRIARVGWTLSGLCW